MERKRNTVIESIGIYLPPDSVSTSEILKGCKNQIHFPLEKITGIKTRPMAGQHEFSIDLAKKAISDCMERSKYHPKDIDLFVCCNISRYDGLNYISFEPNTSVKLRKYFGFGNALAFDMANACAGMFTGIYIAEALIKTGAIRVAMVASGEYITHLTKVAQREIENFMDPRLACLTLGDAGAAIILEEAGDHRIGFQKLDLQTFGRYSPYCVARTSEQGGMIMYTDSVNLTDVAIKSGAKHAVNTLQQTGWPYNSFQHLIMHQTSGMTLNSARQEINRSLKEEVCHNGNTINNLEQRGNSASTSHFVALADQIRNKKINSGDKVVFVISASGLTTGTALYVFDDLPDRLRQTDLLQSPAQKISLEEQVIPVTKLSHPRIRIESVGTIGEDVIGKKNALHLLVQAAENCFSKSSYQCNDISLLIYSGVYRNDYTMEPAYATLLAGELDMNASTTDSNNKSTFAFDIFNGSIGFLNSCYVAQQMIAAENGDTVMIATAEIENNADCYPTELLGIRETASAVILDSGTLKQIGFSRFLFRYYDESINAYTTYGDPSDIDVYLNISKDAKIEYSYIKCVPAVVREILNMESLDLNKVNIIFPPQISSGFITRLSEELEVPLEKFIDVAGEGPDLFTSSLPYAFEYAFEKNLVKSGDIGLIIAVGSGIQVGCAIYHF
jgi:3-oxoacyl-[acyl-carrier-protein] synthase III